MKAADFMSDLPGSDHAVLILKDWRNRTQEDLLAEVAEDLEFGWESDDRTDLSLDGIHAVPGAEAERFLARLGLDLETDLIFSIKNWRETPADELVDFFEELINAQFASEDESEEPEIDSHAPGGFWHTPDDEDSEEPSTGCEAANERSARPEPAFGDLAPGGFWYNGSHWIKVDECAADDDSIKADITEKLLGTIDTQINDLLDRSEKLRTQAEDLIRRTRCVRASDDSHKDDAKTPDCSGFSDSFWRDAAARAWDFSQAANTLGYLNLNNPFRR